MSQQALRVTLRLLGCIPVATGVLGLTGLSDPLYRSLGIPAAPVLDSNLRFFGGVWLGLGLALFWLVPRLETQAALYRALWGMIFLGGVGRLLSMALVGWPPLPFVGFTVLEIVGAPLFVWWHAKEVGRAATPHPG